VLTPSSLKCEAVLADSSRLCIGIVLLFVDEHGCAAVLGAKEAFFSGLCTVFDACDDISCWLPRARGAVDTNSGFFFV
jgi:hypothetical protein